MAEPCCIMVRVKNRNPTVPCWLSLMSAALVTELAASEPTGCHSSPPSLFPTFHLWSFSAQLSFTLMDFFLRSFSLYPPLLSDQALSSSSSTLSPSTSCHHMWLMWIKETQIGAAQNRTGMYCGSHLPCFSPFCSSHAFMT